MFTKARIKPLLKLTLPIFIEILFANLLGTIDTLMISSYSETSVASIGNANSVLGFLIVLFTICSVGIGINVSQYIGAKQYDNADKVLSQGLLVNLFLALIIAMIFYFFNIPLLKLANTPEDVISESSGYIKIVAFGLPFNAMTNCLSQNLKSHSKPLYTTFIAFGANIVNVLLNFLLIFGNKYIHLPALGYKGAAIATLICHVLTFIASYIVTKIVLKQKVFSFKIHWEIMKNIFKIGGPSAFETICYNISQFIVVAQVNKLLTDAMIARSYVNMILGYVYLISVAFASANAILVGYSVGKHDYEEAKITTRISFIIAYPTVMFFVLLVNIGGHFLFPLITSNERVLKEIYQVLPLIFLLETGRCANLVYIKSLQSSGDTLFPVVAAVIFMFSVASFGSYVFSDLLKMGLRGIYLASALDEISRAIVCCLRYRSGKWKEKSIIKEKKTLSEE